MLYIQYQLHNSWGESYIMGTAGVKNPNRNQK